MRNISILLVSTLILLGCRQDSTQQLNNEYNKKTVLKLETDSAASTSGAENKVFKVDQLLHLMPIDTVDSKSKNVYEKYGLEFSGNCYACDLSELALYAKALQMRNVCDINYKKTLEILDIANAHKGFTVKLANCTFIFTEIDKAPIYELKIIGKYINSGNLRISKYYTLKKIVNRFDQHDCGDFQG